MHVDPPLLVPPQPQSVPSIYALVSIFVAKLDAVIYTYSRFISAGVGVDVGVALGRLEGKLNG